MNSGVKISMLVMLLIYYGSYRLGVVVGLSILVNVSVCILSSVVVSVVSDLIVRNVIIMVGVVGVVWWWINCCSSRVLVL